MNARQEREVAALEAETATKAAELAVRAANAIPKPMPSDPREQPFHAALVSAERSALARMMPTRARWPEVVAFETRITEVDLRQNELLTVTIPGLYELVQGGRGGLSGRGGFRSTRSRSARRRRGARA